MTEIRVYPVDDTVIGSRINDIKFLVAIHCPKDSTIRCPKCANESYVKDEKFVVNKNNTVIQKGKCGLADCGTSVRMFRKHDLFSISIPTVEKVFDAKTSHDYSKGKLRSLMGTKSIPTDLLVHMIKIKDYNEHFVFNDNLTLLDFLNAEVVEDTINRHIRPEFTPLQSSPTSPDRPMSPGWPMMRPHQRYQQMYSQQAQQGMPSPQPHSPPFQAQQGMPSPQPHSPPFTAQQQTFGDRTEGQYQCHLCRTSSSLPPASIHPNTGAYFCEDCYDNIVNGLQY